VQRRETERISALRLKIEKDFVTTGTVAEPIMAQEITDCDGNGKVGKKTVSVLGGFLG